jgi:hypothetical protein
MVPTTIGMFIEVIQLKNRTAFVVGVMRLSSASRVSH